MFIPLLDTLLLFTVMTPTVGLAASKLGQRRLIGLHTLVGLLLALGLLLPLYPRVEAQSRLIIVLGSPASMLVGTSLVIDLLSIFLSAIFLIIGLTATIHSIEYMARDTGLVGYYTTLLGMVTGMVGVTLAGDFFTLFIFWEIMCVCSYALVAFGRESQTTAEAGYKYLIMSGTGGITIFFGMSLLYGMTGTLNFSYVSLGLAQSSGSVWIHVAFTMFVIGFGLQAGITPLHTWLPDAHSAAPSPVSAVLSGAMVKTGIYGLLRVLFVAFTSMRDIWQIMIALMALMTMFTGNIMALLQDDIKRLLAFSTVSNMGYVLLGLATGTTKGLAGSLLHVLNHAVVKGLLFLCAGSFIYGAQTRSLKELRGIRHRMPLTSTLFLLGTLALAGIPTLNLFWSEITIMMACFDAGMPIFSALMIANLALSAVYCLRLMQTAMSKEETEKTVTAIETPPSMLVPKLILASILLMIGFCPAPFHSIAEKAARIALDVEGYVIAQLLL